MPLRRSEWLLEQAGRLHEAASDSETWARAVRSIRAEAAAAVPPLNLQEHAWLEDMVENSRLLCAELVRVSLRRAMVEPIRDALSTGVATLDEHGHVLSVNPAGTDLLAASLQEDLHGLAKRVTAEGKPLIAQLRRPETGEVEVLAFPVPSADTISPVGTRVLVLLADPGEALRSKGAELAAIFKLTPAEARMAERLVSGETLATAARSLGIRITTARTHLARLMAKTETVRQPELVKVLCLACLRTSAWRSGALIDRPVDAAQRSEYTPDQE